MKVKYWALILLLSIAACGQTDERVENNVIANADVNSVQASDTNFYLLKTGLSWIMIRFEELVRNDQCSTWHVCLFGVKRDEDTP